VSRHEECGAPGGVAGQGTGFPFPQVRFADSPKLESMGVRNYIRRGTGWVALGCALVVSARAGEMPKLAASRALPARPVPVRTVPRDEFDRALEMRQTFEAETPRTHAGFNRVMEAFRAIYHGNPAAAHAPDAVFQVAQLLEQQGTELDDQRSSEAAIGQYEFLRTQYPASHLRAEALLAEATIAAQDLNDSARARTAYRLVLREVPHGGEARQARAALQEMAGTRLPVTAALSGESVGKPTYREEAAMKGARNESPAPAASLQPVPLEAVAPHRAETLAMVTGIRHWSTPTYTRVAIDLGNDVTFEAARVPHPDRIYFDLHGAKLAPELVGKSFDVTDDGFLKRIRAAQAGPDVTRVVLDVNDVTEYSAFLLPNPYRLIIDIHGRKADAPAMANALPASGDGLVELPVAPAAVHTASVAANRSGLPPMAVTDGGEAVRPTQESYGLGATSASSAKRDDGEALGAAYRGRASVAPAPRTGLLAKSTPMHPVPNTVTVRAPATATEVAAVSTDPGRVDATKAPTSQPITAVVRAGASNRKVSAPAGSADVSADAAIPSPLLGGTRVPPVRTSAGTPARAAEKTADGETSLVRALGLKVSRIVIDAGHGGHDSGTLGVDGIQEKDVVLDVALRLGKLLHERLGAEIIYTRSDDTFIPLETRTAIANKAQADLFLSIHANSSQDPTARGVEVYYLNFTSDPTALDVAARENAVGGQGVHQLSDLVKKIALKDKIEESREFAADVDASLYAGIAKGNEGLRNRGVKKAPFVVLIGANMPSILAEISFVTNAKDAAELRQPEYRERVAESIYKGVASYEAGLAGTKLPPVQRAAIK
jgi:N-acetylmuramoyl-L-alanine amidase